MGNAKFLQERIFVKRAKFSTFFFGSFRNVFAYDGIFYISSWGDGYIISVSKHIRSKPNANFYFFEVKRIDRNFGKKYSAIE